MHRTCRKSHWPSICQDHLAGATAGVNLAWRFVKSHAGTQAGRTLAEVGSEIEADREVLLQLMAELGIEGSRVKNTVAWLIGAPGQAQAERASLGRDCLSGAA